MYAMESGWSVLGYADAPWKSGGGKTRAIVFEKHSPRTDALFDSFSDLEPGVYWSHGELTAKNFMQAADGVSEPTKGGDK